jgi:hypothetical protein
LRPANRVRYVAGNPTSVQKGISSEESTVSGLITGGGGPSSFK